MLNYDYRITSKKVIYIIIAKIYVYIGKKCVKEIKPKNKANERVEVIEMDELYSFV